MASRSLDLLRDRLREMALEHQDRCRILGIDLLIYCTLRSEREQAEMYARGRTIEQILRKARQLEALGYPALGSVQREMGPGPKPKRTFAGPGQSLHQHGRAYDCVPLRGGKPVWRTTGADGELWRRVGEIGEGIGLEWAGRWARFREYVHFQWTSGLELSELIDETYGPPAGDHDAGAIVAAGLPLDESAALRSALAAPWTIFLVFTRLPGVDAATFDQTLERVRGFCSSPMYAGRPRVHLITAPQDLDAQLRALIWQGGPVPVVRLSRGTGLDRQRTHSYLLEELADNLDIHAAFFPPEEL
ncbi:MAG: M15 family metallopeptidase [Thermoanaerobaculia bacterium]|nr:M15 family metallopeptidase [Thermoanaerobaculia bacterium]